MTDTPLCDPAPPDDARTAPKPSSITDFEWGMYVTPDDPARDTPEKARAYYENLFNILAEHNIWYAHLATASPADAAAVKELFGA